MSEQPKIEKKMVEIYKMFNVAGSGWAVFTVDAMDHTGRIQISSDWGSWDNYWNGCGTDFKTFLTRINIDYAADKFHANRWFDVNKTLKLYREVILDYRRQGGLTKEKAAILWKETKKLEDLSKDDFVSKIYNLELFAFFDHCPDMSFGIEPRFRRFWDNCWLPLMELFKQEKEECQTQQN